MLEAEARTLALGAEGAVSELETRLQGQGPKVVAGAGMSPVRTDVRGLRAPTGWPAVEAQDLCGHTDPTLRRIPAHFQTSADTAFLHPELAQELMCVQDAIAGTYCAALRNEICKTACTL